jgi:serine/threonine protein kinase
MSKLQHPNLVQLQAILLHPLRMVMEYAPSGDLFHLLRNREMLPNAKLTWRLRMRIAEDIALGMLYLHSLTPPIVHRDLRSPNVFIMSFEENAPVAAKVADFGLAQRLTLSTGLSQFMLVFFFLSSSVSFFSYVTFSVRSLVPHPVFSSRFHRQARGMAMVRPRGLCLFSKLYRTRRCLFVRNHIMGIGFETVPL